MKIIRTLQVTQKQFYDYLEAQLLDDIHLTNKKRISASDMTKGLKYTKEDSKSHMKTEIQIQKYVRGECYRFKVSYMSDSTTIEYRTKSTDDGLQITMTQHIQSFDSKKHNKLSKNLHEAIYLSRMSNTIYDIEKNILNET